MTKREKKMLRLANWHKRRKRVIGDRWRYNDGHVMVKTEKGNVFEHRLFMEAFLQRKLASDEVVHHKNGIKYDNDLDNLEIMSAEDHLILHRIRLPDGWIKDTED